MPDAPMSMSPDDRTRIRVSLQSLHDSERTFTLLFYGKLFELDPSARALFHNDISAQGAKLMSTLHLLAESLDNLDPMLPRLHQMGRDHARYGVRNSQYDDVSLALLWTFAQALGPDFDPDTHAAWKSALEAVCTAMKSGAAQNESTLA